MHKENGREYLSYVTSQLKARMQRLGASIQEGESEIGQMNTYYWENYTEMDQYGYENFDNQQALFNQHHANEEAKHLLNRFTRMLSNPFFGRVDFQYDGDDEAEIFYIGIGNFAPEEGMVPLIFDWRAPVSGLFYDYDKGRASYEAPMGVLNGEIISKWQYKIRNGKMIYEFESDIKIDDEILKAELGASGEDKLKNIIRTIQREQNAIIRNTQDRILVIQGAAGSGKTSIALHRIAYLLYHDRKNLKSSNILILSPNGIFADYISQILPELGEENIKEMTFDLYAYHQLRDVAADCEDRYAWIEKELSGFYPEKRLQTARYKQSKEFIDRLEGFVLRLEDEIVNFSDVSFGNLSLTADEIVTLFYFRFMDIPLLSRMDAVAEYFIDQVETLRGSDLKEEDRSELLERFRGMYESTDLYAIYRRFLKIERLKTLPKKSFDDRVIPYEDVYPLLYLKYRLKKHRTDDQIRHLVIDEMQDYSWLQFTLLSRLFRCRMTILGDKAQTLEARTQDVRRFLPDIFGKKIRMLQMNKCYRNTNEIAEYANALVGITDMELIGRHGEPVREIACRSRMEALDRIAREVLADADGFETAAVITLSKEEAAEAAQGLKESLSAGGFDTKNRLQLLHADSTRFRKGLTVTTFYLAKGLEFDRVYGLFPAGDQRPLAVQARYVTATRAMHALTMLEIQNMK